MERVLIVDDDRNTRDILRICLERNGYAVTEAEDSEQALLALRATDPAVIVSELVVPWPDGRCMLELLPGMQRAEGGVTVVWTAEASAETRERVEHIGASFLTKPLTPSAVLAEIRRRTA